MQTYYSGLLFDWNHSSNEKRESCLSIARHYLVTFFSLLIMGWTMVFFLFQMGLKLKDKQDMNELIPSLMWVCPLVFAFGTQLFYLVHNKQLVVFIRHWRELEVELNALPNYRDQHERSQKIYSAVYLIKLVLQLGLLTLYICLLILPETANDQQHDWWTLPANVSSSRQLFMMHYPQLTTVAHPFFFVLVHIFSMIFATLFVPLADLVPSLIYGHAATAVHALRSATQQVELNLDDLANQKKKKKEGQEDNQNQEPAADAEAAAESFAVTSSSQIESDLHRIFSLYEGIRVMVKRADDLFGFIVVFNHGLTFLMIVTFAFSLVFWKEAFLYNVAMQVAILVAFVIRIAISLKLMVRLHSASDPL